MWEEQIFKKGQVKVDTVLKEMNITIERLERGTQIEEGAKSYVLAWSVERL